MRQLFSDTLPILENLKRLFAAERNKMKSLNKPYFVAFLLLLLLLAVTVIKCGDQLTNSGQTDIRATSAESNHSAFPVIITGAKVYDANGDELIPCIGAYCPSGTNELDTIYIYSEGIDGTGIQINGSLYLVVQHILADQPGSD